VRGILTPAIFQFENYSLRLHTSCVGCRPQSE
jgi:hypothetical protein